MTCFCTPRQPCPSVTAWVPVRICEWVPGVTRAPTELGGRRLGAWRALVWGAGAGVSWGVRALAAFLRLLEEGLSFCTAAWEEPVPSESRKTPFLFPTYKKSRK